MHAATTLLALLPLLLGPPRWSARAGPTNCGDLKDVGQDESCKASWKELKPRLHPTQPLLGHAWVQYKVDKHMDSADDAQEELDEKPVPVCKGPGNDLWCLDHHHLLAALDYAGLDDTTVTVHVVCDLSTATADLDAFWNTMQTKELAYLMTRPGGNTTLLPSVRMDWRDLPQTIDLGTSWASETGDRGFEDDPWRSLVGFSRKLKGDSCSKANKYCERAFVKGCDSANRAIPFFEFRWGYMFNDAHLLGPQGLWRGLDGYNDFVEAYGNLKPARMGHVDTDAWFDVASLLVPLARSDAAKEYIVPTSQGGCAGHLPGQVPGSGPIKSADPDCAMPLCSDFPPPFH